MVAERKIFSGGCPYDPNTMLVGMGSSGAVFKVPDAQNGFEVHRIVRLADIAGGGMSPEEVTAQYLGRDEKGCGYLDIKDYPGGAVLDPISVRRLQGSFRYGFFMTELSGENHVVQSKAGNKENPLQFFTWMNGLYALNVMEHLDGHDLHDFLWKGMYVRDAAKSAADKGRGLIAMHQKKIRHGDVKPGNSMYVPRCNYAADISQNIEAGRLIHQLGKGRGVTIDFDCAAPGEDYVFPKGIPEEVKDFINLDLFDGMKVVLGTPGYASVDQNKGLKLDTRSDVQSYGFTVYEMLTGRQAFPLSTQPEMTDEQKRYNLMVRVAQMNDDKIDELVTLFKGSLCSYIDSQLVLQLADALEASFHPEAEYRGDIVSLTEGLDKLAAEAPLELIVRRASPHVFLRKY
jgi:serine/threonine protein kinase